MELPKLQDNQIETFFKLLKIKEEQLMKKEEDFSNQLKIKEEQLIQKEEQLIQKERDFSNQLKIKDEQINQIIQLSQGMQNFSSLLIASYQLRSEPSVGYGSIYEKVLSTPRRILAKDNLKNELGSITIPKIFIPITIFSDPPKISKNNKSKKIPLEVESSNHFWEQDKIIKNCVADQMSIEIEDTSKIPYLGKKKPDISGGQFKGIITANKALFVGDLKRIQENKNEGKGQIIFYLILLARAQPLRKKFIGFLTDSSIIQFFVLLRSKADNLVQIGLLDGFEILESEVLSLKNEKILKDFEEKEKVAKKTNILPDIKISTTKTSSLENLSLKKTSTSTIQSRATSLINNKELKKKKENFSSNNQNNNNNNSLVKNKESDYCFPNDENIPEGLRYLIALYCMKPEDIDFISFQFITDQNISIDLIEHLGEGATSNVFKSELNKKIVVVKLFKGEYVLREEKNLKILENIPGIPEFKGSNTKKFPFFLLSSPFLSTQYSISQISIISNQLFSILEEVHKKDIIHCDIRPSNVMFSNDSSKNFVYLIDWGFAININENYTDYLYCGTFTTASFKVLDQMISNKQVQFRKYFPTFQDDLFSAIATIYLLINPSFEKVLNEIPRNLGGFEKIKNLWENHLTKNENWKKCLEIAFNCQKGDYSRLKDEIKKLFCAILFGF